MKFILWAIVILGVLLALRLLASKPGAGSRGAGAGAPPRNPATDGASEPMVRCAHCGIHLPRSEALLKDGQTWCGQAHARLGARQ